MRRIVGLAACALAVSSVAFGAADKYQQSWSTYLGGSGNEQARDVFVDKAGNVYVTGGTASANFPTKASPGSTIYDNTYSGPIPPGGNAGVGSFGNMDVYVQKYNPQGQLIFSTFLGGPGYDRAYGIEVDKDGYIYVAGRAGKYFPTTSGAMQTTFSAYDGPANNTNYGEQNAFVSKLTPDGSNVVFSTYVGNGTLCRDIALDSNGDIYVPFHLDANAPRTVSSTIYGAAFANAFKQNPDAGANGEQGILKIKSDGTQALAGTWIGGSGNEGGNVALRVDASKNVYMEMTTNSTSATLAAKGTGVQTNNGGGPNDLYIAKFNSALSDMIYGTYLGGNGNENSETHGLAIDKYGNAYVALVTSSALNGTFNVTTGTLGATRQGGNDILVAKIGPDGQKLLSTLVGGSGEENPDGIYVDDKGNIVIGGETNSTNFPVTLANAALGPNHQFQTTNKGSDDGIFFVLSADMKSMLFSSYIGGSEYDNVRSLYLGEDGNIYLTGGTQSTETSPIGFPILNAWDPTYNGNTADAQFGSGDGFLVKFTALPEPGAMMTIGVGAGFVALRRRRRHA